MFTLNVLPSYIIHFLPEYTAGIYSFTKYYPTYFIYTF